MRIVLIGRIFVGLGYVLVGFGAILTPVAYALDRLETLRAIAIALVVIACGVALVILGDRLAGDEAVSPPAADPPIDGAPDTSDFRSTE